MIIQDNISTNPGDVIIFTTVPMLNIQSVSVYTDDTTGETGSRFFSRNFCFSLDGGVTFSDWLNLDGGNIANITNVNQYLTSNWHQLVFQFSFTRKGNDPTGQLQINSISINGTIVDRGNVFTISSKGLFRDVVFNNVNVMNLMVNLAQKMYEQGIVPTYLTRKEEESGFNSDEQYIDFWEAIAYFYAIISIDSIKFENIYWRRPLLCEFLRQRNVFICDCTNMRELQLIAQNYYTEMRVRGTEEIFKPMGYQYPIGYRNIYTLPLGYIIQPSTGIFIDGIIYPEIDVMPFGWTLQANGLSVIAGDKNYHKVLFSDSDGNYTIPPVTVSLLFPTTQSGIFKQYNGEYLRLICYNAQCDEFIYNNVSDLYTGWCLNNASPCYEGLRPQRNKSILKAYEKQGSVQDLEVYPLINSNRIFIGITENPYGATDTVMYINSDGAPCFANVIPQLLNVSRHLVVNINSTTQTVEGMIKITNLLTSEEFDVPVSLYGEPHFQILTDLIPARYSIELIFTHSGTMVSNVNDGDALNNYFVDDPGTMDEIYDMTNVGTDTLYVDLNFS